jgi:hypothetical protein
MGGERTQPSVGAGLARAYAWAGRPRFQGTAPSPPAPWEHFAPMSDGVPVEQPRALA